MPDILYFIWAILPLALLWITIKAGTKSALNSGKREYPATYLRQLIFSIAAYLVSIFIDKKLLSPGDSLTDLIEGSGIDIRLVRWLTFPAIIATAAVIQQYFIDKKKKADEALQTERRMKYAPK